MEKANNFYKLNKKIYHINHINVEDILSDQKSRLLNYSLDTDDSKLFNIEYSNISLGNSDD